MQQLIRICIGKQMQVLGCWEVRNPERIYKMHETRTMIVKLCMENSDLEVAPHTFRRNNHRHILEIQPWQQIFIHSNIWTAGDCDCPCNLQIMRALGGKA